MKASTPTCPRRKVIASEYRPRFKHSWKLTLECGHCQERWFLDALWTPPKTTQYGRCWRPS